MKKIIIIILTFNFSFSQKIIIVDIQTKQPLSYANLYFYNNNELLYGNYCNVNGNFNVSDVANYNKVKFTHIGYEDKIINHILGNDTIFLTPSINNLKEIVLLNKTSDRLIGYSNLKNKLYLSAQRYCETVVFIDNKRKTLEGIKSFLFQIKKNKKYNTIIKIHLYENNIIKNEPGNELLQENIIYIIKKNESGLIEIDLQKYNLSLPIDGAFVGIEWLGIDDNNSIEIFFKTQNELDTNVQFNDEIKEPLTFMRNRFKDDKWESSATLKLNLKNFVDFKYYPNASFGIKVN